MNTKLILLSSLELTLSLLLGVAMLYITYYVIQQRISKHYAIDKKNLAYAVLVSAILFSVGNIMEGAIDPIGNVIRQFSVAYDSLSTVFFESMKYIAMFILLSMLLALVINVVAVQLFTGLTKVDEFQEIADNNVAPALITGTITIVISIFAKSPAVQLMEAIIPYPDLPAIL